MQFILSKINYKSPKESAYIQRLNTMLYSIQYNCVRFVKVDTLFRKKGYCDEENCY